MSNPEGSRPPAEDAHGLAEVAIPEPAGLPLLGNIMALDSEFPLGSMKSLSDEYGEIYRLRFPDRTVVIVSTQALVNETCNEKRFKKSINTALKEVRSGVHDGLFTARMGEENWGIAHRILMPAFGPLSIQGMFDDMHDIASQLALKWARQGSSFSIPVTDDFTRLTLDTLALCAMGYRFNSYYSPELHPFIEAMGDFLTEAGEKPRRLPLPSLFYSAKDRKYESDIDIMRNTAKEVLEARKTAEDSRHDLLNAMLKGVDPKTGKKMTDDSIMDNLITFLIAGHETTSGLLSFAFYQLCSHPEAYRKAQQEVDSVVGQGAIEVKHMSKLPYISAVLRETLRLNSTIPLFTVESFEDTIIGEKYRVNAGETIVNLLAKSHLDPAVFGDSANEFIPERMLDEPFEQMQADFPNCWKPFGNGMRACIGRPFAWQESLLVMAMLLQNFNFVLEPSYKLGYKQTLTIKPKDLTMRAILRDGLDAASLQRRLAGQPSVKPNGPLAKPDIDAAGEKIPVTILYGSNSGTCEALAQRAASDAAAHGFIATRVDCLDTANGSLPKDHPVIIITASYEGQPPDNAGHFVKWLEEANQETESMKDVSYAIFGCGDKNWAQTFHRIPKLVHDRLQDFGAELVGDFGLSDVSQGQVFTDFENWEDHVLWPAMTAKYNAIPSSTDEKSGIDVTISKSRASTLRQEVAEGEVTDARALVTDSTGNVLKKHIEVQLPDGMSYSAGDYLVVLPFNPAETVNRVLRRFRMARDSRLEIHTNSPTSLPLNIALSAYDVLSSYVELAQPATKRNILTLAGSATLEATNTRLGQLADEDFSAVSSKRTSILDILEQFPDIELPLATFIGMLPPMRVRQYSISSSPLKDSSRASISFSILQAPSLSGLGTHVGVATSYLSSLSKGDKVQLSIRASPSAFSLPTDPATTPLICIAAGTGLAPFRGFMQERAAQRSAGRAIAPAILFFGCRGASDDLYRDELDAWERSGVVEVKRAYSREPEKSDGCKYVQDRMMKEKDTAVKLWKAGAKVYVCGSRGIADSVRDAVLAMKTAALEEEGRDAEVQGVEEWFEELRNIRYVLDVFD